ncbi:Lytic transglycosylase catalytic [Granulicella tundricola MP5ACTX9]|uniref:Lytic transglycosylase catalytic n=2 Tax=Granulicella TaxID=940557 RepID=E8WZU3_GRATM|nr:Lytic transglycosylase catalytic [Granulicella tundricola MP5ACTX9]
MTSKLSAHRALLALLCAPLLLLAGCPGDPPTLDTTAPGSISPMATAPTNGKQTPAGTAQAAAAPNSTSAAQQPVQTGSPKADQIIKQAESSYNSGVANYRNNRLDAARMDFDFAIDTMLSSGLDLKTESPVADEFNRLLDAINSLEMAALKQGNGFSPKLDVAPLDAAEDITFAANPELVARLKNELNVTSDLPLVINDQVAGYIGVFSTSNSFRAHMAASLQRVGKYRGLIQNVLKEEGVPQDLIYLAVAESGFQPQVVNAHSGAGGMWQFMASTGTEYGLTRNGYFDYRFDPEKSSRAYARYIKALYNQFGDWYLAMASYNWGPGNIQRDVQRTGYADYWALYRLGLMPAQTRAYVPQILAAIIMAKNPERYGLDKLVPSPAVIYDTVSTSYSIDMHLVADVTGSTVPEIVALNPALLRLATPRDTSFDLHLPPGTKTLYNDRLKDIPEDRRASWRFHIVKAGETLDTIATALHARTADIAETNSITAQDPMSTGDELVVPVQTVTAAARPQRYTLRRGDTLVTVADQFNVSVEELRSWNNIASSGARAGRTIYVAEPIRLGSSGRSRGRGRGGRGGSKGRGRGGRASSGKASSRGGHAASAKASSHSASHSSGHASHAAAAPKSAKGKHKAGR